MTKPARVRERIAALTIAISVRSLPRIVGALTESKITVQQLKVLTAIVVEDGATISGLAHASGVSTATMSKLVDRLVTQRLIERLADSDDQRVRRLQPTSLGRDVVSEVLGARPELGNDVLQGLDMEELEALERGLQAINRELQRLAPEHPAG